MSMFFNTLTQVPIIIRSKHAMDCAFYHAKSSIAIDLNIIPP
jgi:hypothetical protein